MNVRLGETPEKSFVTPVTCNSKAFCYSGNLQLTLRPQRPKTILCMLIAVKEPMVFTACPARAVTSCGLGLALSLASTKRRFELCLGLNSCIVSNTRSVSVSRSCASSHREWSHTQGPGDRRPGASVVMHLSFGRRDGKESGIWFAILTSPGTFMSI